MIVESFRYVAAAGAALSVLTGCEDKQGFDPAKISSNLGVFTETSVSLADRRLVEIQIGNLKLPDGRLVAFDPLVQPESRPFAQTVTPGTYPVSFIRGAAGYSRPAMLVIRFSNAEIERFELATIEGQDVGSQVDWGLLFGSIPSRPAFEAYAERFRERDGYKAAKAIDNQLMEEAKQ